MDEDILADVLENDTDQFVIDTHAIDDIVRFLYEIREQHSLQFATIDATAYESRGFYFLIGKQRNYNVDLTQVLYRTRLAKTERKIVDKFKNSNYSHRSGTGHELCANVCWSQGCNKTIVLHVFGTDNFNELNKLLKSFPTKYNRRITLKMQIPINNNSFLLLKV